MKTYEEIGVIEGVTKQSVQERADRGVGKIVAHLNGKTYTESLDEAA